MAYNSYIRDIFNPLREVSKIRLPKFLPKLISAAYMVLIVCLGHPLKPQVQFPVLVDSVARQVMPVWPEWNKKTVSLRCFSVRAAKHVMYGHRVAAGYVAMFQVIGQDAIQLFSCHI